LLALASCAAPIPQVRDSVASRTELRESESAPPLQEPARGSAEEAALEGLASAQQLIASRRYDEAETLLRELGGTEISARALLLRAQVALSRGESPAAIFYLKQALDSDPSAEIRYEINLAIGDLLYRTGDAEGAFRHYLEALHRIPFDRAVEDSVWLRLAETAFYRHRDRELARYYLLQAPGLSAQGADQEVLRRLLRRISWQELGPDALGVGDGNVSALAADGDDLWIGTWNGGVVRYTLGSGQAAVFREGRASLTPNTVRSIEVTDTRVWIGTYQGLFVYSKPSSSWSEIPEFGGANPRRTEAIRAVGQDLYVGTLGDGLWRLSHGRWSRIASGVLPGDFVNTLAYVDSHLLIGTLNLGIVVLDPATQSMWSFDRVNPDLAARNIILLLPVGTQELWIGTYGQGLYRWNRAENRLSHFAKAGGTLGDDWVLSGAATSSGLYFGTFGAGVSRYRDGRWRQVGLRDGLAGLDVSAVAYAPPYVAFGTLGSGITLFDESLALAGFSVLE